MIGFVDDKVGLGVFAVRPISKGEFIIHERPVIAAVFNEKDSDNTSDMKLQEEAVRDALSGTGSVRLAVALAFPRLAADTGLPLVPLEIAGAPPLEAVGVMLAHGGLQPTPAAGIKEYLQYVSSIPVSEKPTRSRRRQVSRDFFKHYAFQVRPPKPAAKAPSLEPSKACIYLLGSLINHCCSGNPGPNCEFQIGPGGLAKFIENDAIAIRATRDIMVGEELTINYGKRRKGFDCQCESCAKLPTRGRELCNMM